MATSDGAALFKNDAATSQPPQVGNHIGQLLVVQLVRREGAHAARTLANHNRQRPVVRVALGQLLPADRWPDAGASARMAGIALDEENALAG